MGYQNLGDFLKENSQRHKERIAYEIKRGLRTQRFTFADVYSLARKTASFLQQKGLRKGDRVAIWAPNMPEYPILYFGCWLLGVVVVPIDIRTTQETVKIFLTKAKCKIGFKGKFVPGSFRGLVKESFYLEDLIDLVSHLPGVKLDHLEGVRTSDLAEIAFTSGTTGTPKGVMLTHQNFLSDVEVLTAAFPFKKEYRVLSLLPLSHAFEQVVGFLTAYQTGIAVTYIERINALTILRTFKKSKITSVALVPQVLRLLMNGIEREVESQGKTKQFQFASRLASYLPLPLRRPMFREIHKKLGGKLLFFGSGSAPLDLKLAQKWENLGIEVFEGYGATETTAALTINTPNNKLLGSVGKVLPGVKVRISPNPEVGSYSTPGVESVKTPGVEGQIEARGPNISPGYFEDEDKTKTAFRNGWYRTGDVGQFDKDGFLYITGREAFRIVLPNGQKVYPEDLEKKLNAHPLIKEACVTGIKREEGEVVHSAIITEHPAKLEQIVRDVNRELASHEQILEWSHWPDEDFPRTPILKIDRRKVLEIIEETAVEATPRRSRASDLRGAKLDRLIQLVSQVTEISPSKIKEDASLATDLKLDSLGRVELLSLIEQEFGVAVSETKINPQTTVSQLRRLIKEPPTSVEEIAINEFMYSPFMMKLRAYIIHHLFFGPLHRFFVPMEITGKENLKKVQFPAIIYFNHVGIFDALCVLRAFSNEERSRIVMAVNEDLWHDYRKNWVEIFGAGFPFDKTKRVKASLELTGEFLDRGFSIIMSPEGTFTKDGKLLEFKPGIGLLAVEMQVPVIPIKIDSSYLEIFPPMGSSFWENLPKKRKKIALIIGKPLVFTKGTSYETAAKDMREAIEKL